MRRVWNSAVPLGTPVELYRDALTREPTMGRLVAVSDHCLLIERLIDDYVWDGVAVLLVRDVTRVKWNSEELQRGALLADGRPRVDAVGDNACERVVIENVEECLVSMNEVFGRVTLYLERLDPDICLVGGVSSVSGDHVVLDQLSALRNRERSSVSVSLLDITRVDGGGAYQCGLAMMYEQA